MSRSAGRWLVVAGAGEPQEIINEIARGLAPRIDYIELSRKVGGSTIAQLHRGRGASGRLRRKLDQLASSLQAYLYSGEADTIYTTGEDISFWLAPLLRASRWKGRLITVTHNSGSPKGRRLIRLMPKGASDTFACFCRSQEKILVDELGVPSRNVLRVTNPIDFEFFSPTPGVIPDSVFSAGREMRDYETLCEAAAGLAIPFVISASGFLATAAGPQATPQNVSILSERVSYARIKALYDRARLVVVPLHPCDYAAGVNGVLEAMAMAKPVVTTRSPGLEDYVRDGETGRVTPPDDAWALRAAIVELWRRPDRCAAIGLRNRAWIEQHAALSTYCARLREAASGAAATDRAA
jgi:glycosyltransferase involved in cell wall biosynthesis